MFRSPVPSVNCKLFNFSECYISIHVPIAGNDARPAARQGAGKHFNPRSHCRERRTGRYQFDSAGVFQSTFPLQGTTMCIRMWLETLEYFNPRSHCRERRKETTKGTQPRKISIHVPIAGNDKVPGPIGTSLWYFNPRSHCRERPYLKFHIVYRHLISIHVPIAGNDYRKVSFRRI